MAIDESAAVSIDPNDPSVLAVGVSSAVAHPERVFGEGVRRGCSERVFVVKSLCDELTMICSS